MEEKQNFWSAYCLPYDTFVELEEGALELLCAKSLELGSFLRCNFIIFSYKDKV